MSHLSETCGCDSHLGIVCLCIGLAMTQTKLTATRNLVHSMQTSADTTTQNVLQDRTKK